ncbi:MAG: transglutaminase-like domain-containing protein [Halanaerobiales bacterium]|nr:transglutaminase-like domain-containing protein [Halanaerobiales bacterium]
MPIPKNWDNHGTNEIEILNIEPEPTELYTDEHGNKIAYWKNNSDEKNEYKIEFEITISNINHDISKEDYDINYDETSEIYKKYTSSRNKTQSDAPEIIEKANEIVGDTLDPVQKARKILKWTSTNIESDGNVPYDLPDALSVSEYQKGHCGAFVNIFVALSRASGIPARNVSLIHHPDDNQFKSGSHSDTFWGHLIAEIYLQDYGWVQIDIVRGDWFGKIEENIIILSKGNEFELKNAEFETKDIAFHLPLKSRADGSLVQFKSYIEVEKLN